MYNQQNSNNRFDIPWYKDGLKFKCTECGKCCTGSPGHVWLSDDEIIAMAEHLKLSIDDFAMRYLRLVNGRIALLEDPRTYDCIFLKDKKCQIYSLRPKQCRTFPWWQRNLKSREDWNEAASYCEGINPAAPIVPIEVITKQLNIQEAP